jgi:hypothetical protein
MDFLTLILVLELGFNPTNVYFFDASQMAYAYQEDVVYTYLEGGVEIWGTLYVGGSVRTDTQMIGLETYAPYHAEYWFFLNIDIGPVEIGYRHLCVHPVVTEGFEWHMRGGKDEYYIRFSNKEN